MNSTLTRTLKVLTFVLATFCSTGLLVAAGLGDEGVVPAPVAEHR